MSTSFDKDHPPPPQQQQQHPFVGNDTGETEMDYLPSESQLVLMCLDYLRDLRRAYPNKQDLLDAEGLHADWLTLAIYALARSFSMQGSTSSRAKNSNAAAAGTFGIPNYNHITMPVFNDAWMDSHRVMIEASISQQEEMMNPSTSPNIKHLPSVEEMTKHILYPENPFANEDMLSDESDDDRNVRRNKSSSEEKKDNVHDFTDSYAWYEYDDYHPSNSNRFYLFNGVASTINGRGPLMFAEVAAAGLYQLQAKSRRQAEDDMMSSPLFEQFVNAVRNKGFFDDPENATPKSDPKEDEDRLILQKAVYDERMAKVVSKFRNKLAAKIDLQSSVGDGNKMMTQSLDYHHNRRMKQIVHTRKLKSMGLGMMNTTSIPPQMKATSMHLRSVGITTALDNNNNKNSPVAGDNKQTAEEAERLKSQGNAYMQKKEYEAAMECYTQALRLSPSGPQSHVYFSNRAAALLSMKKFDQAILDSERALALQPTYGKAHARLGLAHFLLGDYRHAMEAYTVALKYEPDNKSSKSYLEKAAKKLAAQEEESSGESGSAAGPGGSSFSVVSEWDKSNNKDGRKSGKYSRRNSGSSVSSNHSNNARNTHNNATTKAAKKPNRLPGLPNEAAEQQKTKGNAHMANREYDLALECYNVAVKLSPNGPQSHVYYSNRAAALCYLECYVEAAEDSEQAIQLRPTYGKAYARLGLSRFFMQDYEGAIEAYTAALEYDPDNAASKSYLAKAMQKLERQQQDEGCNISEDARRLMDDPDMILMARKVMQSNSATSEQDLLQDPEMQRISRRAMADPTMMEAIQTIRHVDPHTLSPSTSRHKGW